MHGMEEYRHGHGLLRGCFRQMDKDRLAVNERPLGLDFVFNTASRTLPSLVWADDAFLAWCRLPAQVSVAEKAYKLARKLRLVESTWDDVQMRPHRAVERPLVNAEPTAARFRHLTGARSLTDLCEPSALVNLPSAVFIECANQRLCAYFPLARDPNVPLAAVLEVIQLHLI